MLVASQLRFTLLELAHACAIILADVPGINFHDVPRVEEMTDCHNTPGMWLQFDVHEGRPDVHHYALFYHPSRRNFEIRRELPEGSWTTVKGALSSAASARLWMLENEM